MNDPGYERALQRGVNKERAEAERERLFGIIRRLVQWKNTNNNAVLEEAREEIWKSWRETCALNKNHPQASQLFDPEKLPALYDPFAGGGSIPLEAQWLGLEAHASDLNPVAVLINKAMIEYPAKFNGSSPVNPESRKQGRLDGWRGVQGIAEDLNFYGQWMREEAERKIGHLYPGIKITPEMAQDRPDLQEYVGKHLKITAWLWARTVKSPNPAFSEHDVPLVGTFYLAKKKQKQIWVEPIISKDGLDYEFIVRTSGTPTIVETVNRRGGYCILSGSPIDFKYIRSEGQAGRMGTRLLAIIAEGKNGRVYLSPNAENEIIAKKVELVEAPITELPLQALGFRVQQYGMKRWIDLFTPRQLVTLSTFADLIPKVHAKIIGEINNNASEGGIEHTSAGPRSTEYADAICLYLTFAITRLADYNNQICIWKTSGEQVIHLFRSKTVPMTWDFPESNVFSKISICWDNCVKYTIESLDKVGSNFPGSKAGFAIQKSALERQHECAIISTDPPYFDNIGYADLSDFFYVWHRKSLKAIFPDLLATLTVPKSEELVATPYRHSSKKAAEAFFMHGMMQAMANLSQQSHPGFPITIYYAFKQTETSDDETSSIGWEAFLEAIIKSNLMILGTWPMSTEQEKGLKTGTNALGSSIVLVCRPRNLGGRKASRKEFLQVLRTELPEALGAMTSGETTPIAPVDFAQAAIGPGMAVFSRYEAVLEADGTPMPVRTALTLINKALDEYFAEAEGDLDSDTRFAIAWFEEFGWAPGAFGQADVLARAKGTSVDDVRAAGVVESGGGNVRLLRPGEYDIDWNPANDSRLPIWEALHHLSRALQSGGESEAGTLLAALGAKAAPVRQLAYRLYTLCERKGWAEDARQYNELITSWHAVEAVSHDVTTASHGPQSTFDTFGA